jgi:hypothetical protein
VSQPWDVPLFCDHGNPVGSCLACRAEGQQRGQEGQDQAASSAAALAWWRAAWSTLLHLAAGGEPFTSEHITGQVGLPRKSATGANSAMGALMGTASRTGIIELVGSTPASRPISHGAQIGVWKGVDQPW